MKAPFLVLTALALTLPALSHATENSLDARERAAREAKVMAATHKADDKLDHAWDRIEDVGADLRDGMIGAIDDFMGGTRDVFHSRPELQSLPHLVVLRKGSEAKIAYCRPLIAQIFRNRDKHPGHNRCDEVLTKGSFNVKELQACSARHAQEGGAAFNLQRQLARVIERDEDYNYNYEAMYGSREEYRELFKQCALERKPASKPKKKTLPPPVVVAPPAAPMPPEKPVLEFKPVDHSADHAPAEVNGTLGE